jgi:hypothetical protein
VKEMTEIIGVTFPLQKKFIDRFFIQKKTVFIKPATIFSQLRTGMELFLYQSRQDTGFVGVATIKSVTLSEDPATFYDKFGTKIFLTRKELDDYIEMSKRWRTSSKNPKKKKWIAIELNNIKKYENVIKPKRFVTVSGRYITKEEELEITNLN